MDIISITLGIVIGLFLGIIIGKVMGRTGMNQALNEQNLHFRKIIVKIVFIATLIVVIIFLYLKYLG